MNMDMSKDMPVIMNRVLAVLERQEEIMKGVARALSGITELQESTYNLLSKAATQQAKDMDTLFSLVDKTNKAVGNMSESLAGMRSQDDDAAAAQNDAIRRLLDKLASI